VFIGGGGRLYFVRMLIKINSSFPEYIDKEPFKCSINVEISEINLVVIHSKK
jgi:hypothetical protein